MPPARRGAAAPAPPAMKQLGLGGRGAGRPPMKKGLGAGRPPMKKGLGVGTPTGMQADLASLLGPRRSPDEVQPQAEPTGGVLVRWKYNRHDGGDKDTLVDQEQRVGGSRDAAAASVAGRGLGERSARWLQIGGGYRSEVVTDRRWSQIGGGHRSEVVIDCASMEAG